MKQTIKYSVLLFLFIATIDLTLLAQTNDFTIKVKNGVALEQPLQVKYYNSVDWESFHADIESFSYDPNYNYALRVRRTKLKNLPINKPNYRYTLVKTIYKKPIIAKKLTLDINDKWVDCQGVGQVKCLQVKFNPNDNWEYFYSDIKGFNYQEGFIYKIIVNRIKVDNPPQDASGYQYELVKVLAKTASKKTSPLPSAAVFLSRYKWKLISLNRKDVSNYNAYILFDADRGLISGNSSCNNFFGPFIISSNKIEFPNLGTTMRACMGENIEAQLYTVLENKDIHYDIADQTLNFYIKNEHIAIFGLTNK